MPSDEASRAAYFTAAGGDQVRYELHRVYSTMLKKGPVNASILAGILEHAAAITSDYDESETLRDVLASQQLVDRTRPLFFTALDHIGSDYERHRVLSAVLKTGDRAAMAPAIDAASRDRQRLRGGVAAARNARHRAARGSAARSVLSRGHRALLVGVRDGARPESVGVAR